MPPNHQTRTDQFVSDFFHSKTWKVLLTIWLSMFGVAILCVCAIWAVFSTSLAVPILSIVEEVSGLELGTPVAFEAPVLVVTSPSVPRATPLPTTVHAAEPEWVWWNIDLYDLVIELPETWVMYEVDRQSNFPLCEEVGHDIANYLILSLDQNSEVEIRMLCGPRGGEGPRPCPEGSALIDPARDLGRRTWLETQYLYTEVTGTPGALTCGDEWRLGDMAMVFTYTQWNGVWNFDVVDRIVASIRAR